MPWDSNIATSHFKGKLEVQSFNQLMGALRENCGIVSMSVPSPLDVDLVKYDLFPDLFFSSFQTAVSDLIPLFVNYEDNGGNWEGQTSIPNYTEATMLTAIGDASRLPAPTNWETSSTWCFQQFRMLNKMRWIQKYLDLANLCEAKGSGIFSHPSDLDLVKSQAQAAYDVASWVAYPYLNWLNVQKWIGNSQEPPSVSAMISNLRNSVTWTKSVTLKSSEDIYPYVELMLGTYDNQSPLGYSTADKFHKYLTIAENDTAVNTLVLQFDDPVGVWYSGVKINSGTSVAVIKYDGANGKTFKDW